jgi:hypothetical protein
MRFSLASYSSLSALEKPENFGLASLILLLPKSRQFELHFFILHGGPT